MVGGKPAVFGNDLQTADRGAVAGRGSEFVQDRVASHAFCLDQVGRKVGQNGFLSRRSGSVHAGIPAAAQFRFKRLIMLTGVFASYGDDLRCQQVEDNAILVGRPGLSVLAQEGSPGAFFAAKANFATEQSGHEPLEADRHFA